MFDGPLEALRESGDDARGAEVVRRQPRDCEELVAAVADEVRLPVDRVLEQVQVQGALAVRAEAALPDVRPLWPVRRRDAHATELVAHQPGARRARLVAERLRVLVVRAVVPLHGPAGQVEVEPHDKLARLPVIQHLWALHHLPGEGVRPPRRLCHSVCQPSARGRRWRGRHVREQWRRGSRLDLGAGHGREQCKLRGRRSRLDLGWACGCGTVETVVRKGRRK
mmetsp:Transcript_42841/g.138979  ORF Transcript_42841/g.138979 Transcript_42841/m.138979 type:complete len:224 (+) Transcript_42841:730-1401(+)